MWLKENWFKLSILLVVVFLSCYAVFYFSVSLPKREKIKGDQETAQKLQQLLKDQDSKIAQTNKMAQAQATATPATQVLPASQKKDTSNTSIKNQGSTNNETANNATVQPTPVPSPAATSTPTNTTSDYCIKLNNDYNAAYVKLVIILQNVAAIKADYDSVAITNLGTAYQQLSAQKNSFYSEISQLISSVNDLSVPSFASTEILSLKQNFVAGANSYQNAFDLKIEAFKFVYDKPSSIPAYDDARATLALALKKAIAGGQSFYDGTANATNFWNQYNQLKDQNNCK